MNEPHFKIRSTESISMEFINRNACNFSEAAEYIKHLTYQRNADKNNLISVFKENCGTCSTKHSVLKQLAIENNFEEVKLFIGIFKMNGINTPEVAKTLYGSELEYIPEAHCYLKFKGEILDYTKLGFENHLFKKDLLEECEILPHQISDYKINKHQAYIRKWLGANPDIRYSFEEIWEIREQCIRDLSL